MTAYRFGARAQKPFDAAFETTAVLDSSDGGTENSRVQVVITNFKRLTLTNFKRIDTIKKFWRLKRNNFR